MIVAAGLLVLLGLGLFVAGVLTGTTAFYWACVAVCVAASLLLLVARRRISAAARAVPSPDAAREGGAARAPEGAAGRAAAAHVRGQPAYLSDPPVEDVEVTDLLLVVDLKDEVLVVDEHPRYHLPGCTSLSGRSTIPLPVDEARTDGFTPCATCSPDRNLADRARARKHADGS